MASLSDDARSVPRALSGHVCHPTVRRNKSVFALLGKLPLLRQQNQRLAHIQREHAPLFTLESLITMAKKSTAASPGASDPQTKHEIRPGQSIELLKELHILTRDGKMNQDSRRKLKQVYHLFQFIEPLLADVHQRQGSVSLVDHGAGKSYLGFILYDLFFKTLRDRSHIYGIETREELVKSRRNWHNGSASIACPS